MRVSCKYGLPVWYSLDRQLWLLERDIYISSVLYTVNDMWLLIEPISWHMTLLYLNVIKVHCSLSSMVIHIPNIFICILYLSYLLIKLFLISYFKSMDSFQLVLFPTPFLLFNRHTYMTTCFPPIFTIKQSWSKYWNGNDAKETSECLICNSVHDSLGLILEILKK